MKKPNYNNKRVFRKTIISEAEYDTVLAEAAAAHEILNEPRFEFVRNILEQARDYASTSIIENTVMDVTEEVTISDQLKRLFRQPKKVQVDELSGQYKLVKKFFNELQDYIDTKDSLLDKVANDEVIVERVTEKDA